MRVQLSQLLCLSFAACCLALTMPGGYNPVWTSQSNISQDSMPVGGGDMGLNVWVENNDLLFYIARSGTFDESNAFLKLGRVRVKLDPNPWSTNFRQELKLTDGYQEITGGSGSSAVAIQIWADVFNPVAHVDIKSGKNINITVGYESWRWQDHNVTSNLELDEDSYKNVPNATTIILKDTIGFEGNRVLFYHANKAETVFDVTIAQQSLDDIKNTQYNPLGGNIFGGMVSGEGLVKADVTGPFNYVNATYKSWNLRSARPGRSFSLQIPIHIQQTDLATWKKGLHKIKTDSKPASSRAWWQAFWDRSHIFINTSSGPPNTTDPAWQVGRNYNVFRYQLGCNAKSKGWPTKWNGGLFTYDPYWIDHGRVWSPDFRRWTGGCHTAQNQRLVYWPLLKSGDTDVMVSQFDFYNRLVPGSIARAKKNFGIDAAFFTEQLENFGLPRLFEYNAAQYNGIPRPSYFRVGVQWNDFLGFLWETVLEFDMMILEARQYADFDIKPYMPLIENTLMWFDIFYQREHTYQDSKTLTSSGKLILYPASGAETYKAAYNPTNTIAGLKALLTRLTTTLDDSYFTKGNLTYYSAFLRRIPDWTYRSFNGTTTIAPAVAYARLQNSEMPQLYPVFPWGFIQVGLPNLTQAIDTYHNDPEIQGFKGYTSWKQDNIFTARMGLLSEAQAWCIKKLQDSGRRMTTFWGPGQDWAPDHNWGGSGMIGLQEMIMQTSNRTIRIAPTWPTEWFADFKLKAPFNTTVEGKIVGGKVQDLVVTPPERMADVVYYQD